MSVRAADARLFAGTPARRVTVLGQLDGWSAALSEAGVDVVTDHPDLVVTTGREARAAVALNAPTVVVIGSARRALQSAGYATRTLLTRNGTSGPRLYVPVDARRATAHMLTAATDARAIVKRLLAHATIAVGRAGAPVPGFLTVGTKPRARPAFLNMAVPFGVAPTDDWCLLTGEGDDLQRLVWLVFAHHASQPTWVVKCSRVRGNTAPFDQDETAMSALDRLPSALRHRAPAVLGRFDLDGLPALVESAAPGQPMHVVPAGARFDRAVEEVADWIVAVGQASRGEPAAMDPELERLASEVLPRWVDQGAPPDLVSSLPSIAPVLQHNDLGCWNILVDDDTFAVVDWESGRGAGLPLWDLAYFLSDAGSTREARAGAVKDRAVLDLLRGLLPWSALLFRRLAATADALDIPIDSVGAIVTLGWLHHGLSARARAEVQRALGAAAAFLPPDAPLERIAPSWLRDPLLGPGWPAFRTAIGR